MEFYPFALIFRHSHLGVSIPNGMEFYAKLPDLMRTLCQFQFPTGWNSTDLDAYSGSDYASFNSQRDGILQKKERALCLLTKVSIPNGMEFYALRYDTAHPKIGFNSQRDGILQKRRFSPHHTDIVSIPNGMEFYNGKPQSIITPKTVSIPNGMEFYTTTAGKR